MNPNTQNGLAALERKEFQTALSYYELAAKETINTPEYDDVCYTLSYIYYHHIKHSPQALLWLNEIQNDNYHPSSIVPVRLTSTDIQIMNASITPLSEQERQSLQEYRQTNLEVKKLSRKSHESILALKNSVIFTEDGRAFLIGKKITNLYQIARLRIGKIKYAASVDSGELVCLKVFDPPYQYAEDFYLKNIKNEINALKHLGLFFGEQSKRSKHCQPNELFQKRYIFRKWAEGTKVEMYADRENMSLVEKLKVLIAYLTALHKLHQKGWAHGDPHPENCIYNEQTKIAEFIDFEHSLKCTPALKKKDVELAAREIRSFLERHNSITKKIIPEKLLLMFDLVAKKQSSIHEKIYSAADLDSAIALANEFLPYLIQQIKVVIGELELETLRTTTSTKKEKDIAKSQKTEPSQALNLTLQGIYSKRSKQPADDKTPLLKQDKQNDQNSNNSEKTPSTQQCGCCIIL